MNSKTSDWIVAFGNWTKIWDRSEAVKFSEGGTIGNAGRPVFKAEVEDADGNIFEYEYNFEDEDWHVKTCRRPA